jgi:nucleoid-associated protein EbfC
MSDLSNLLKQAQMMQEQMHKAQEEIARQEVIGEAGAGMVSITMNGRHEVRKVQLDSGILGEDKEVVEDLIAAAMNDAVRKVAENNKQQFAGLASGLNLPPGFKLPF